MKKVPHLRQIKKKEIDNLKFTARNIDALYTAMNDGGVYTPLDKNGTTSNAQGVDAVNFSGLTGSAKQTAIGTALDQIFGYTSI